MKFLSLLCLGAVMAALPCASLRAEDDVAPRKRGGFTGATPKPVPKKTMSAESTPMPKKKRKAPDEDAPVEKKADAAAKHSKALDDEEKVAPVKESGQAAKRKKRLPEEGIAAEKKTEPSGLPARPLKTSEVQEEIAPPVKPEHAPAATLEPAELAEFANLPPRTQSLITAALALTKLNLTYTYGSDDPAQGGMDCSGTMAWVLRAQGFKDVPRDSSSQYVWARKGGPFFAVVSKSAESFEFKDLQPGDLLFWTGTYETAREIPISHVMLYLGTEKKTKKRVMFGASDGRSYAGIQRWGVSVFDFKMPNGTAANGEKTKVDFVGYGRIPGLRETMREPVVEKLPSTPAPVTAAATTPKPRGSITAASSTPRSRKKKVSE